VTRCSGGPYSGAVDPGASFRPDGVAFLALQPSGQGSGANSAQVVSASPDGGANWTPPTVIQPADGVNDRQRGPVAWDTANPSRGYIAWQRFRAPPPAPSTTADLYISTTTDGGRTWGASRAIYLATAPDAQELHNVLHVLPDGALLATFEIVHTQSREPFCGPVGFQPPSCYGASPENLIVAMRSEDQGKTWSTPVTVAQVSPRSELGMPSAVAPDGTVYVVWHSIPEGRGSYARLQMARSRDGGRTWEPVSLGLGDGLTPSIAVMGDGTVGVGWYSTTPTKTRTVGNYMLTYSQDQGAHWRTITLGGPFDYGTARTPQSPAATSPAPASSDPTPHPFGDYMDLAALPDGFASVFGMSRPAAKVGSQDIFYARVRLAATAVTRPPASAPAPARLPASAACRSRRRLTIHLRAPRGDAPRDATIVISGRRARVLHGKRLHARIDLRGLPHGRFTITIVTHTRQGRTLRTTRAYRTCTPGRRRRPSLR
jgi:hypothetical protein